MAKPLRSKNAVPEAVRKGSWMESRGQKGKDGTDEDELKLMPVSLSLILIMWVYIRETRTLHHGAKYTSIDPGGSLN